MESPVDVRVKWRRTVTSLQVFPASDVMKMLTLVLASSAPTTPGYRKDPTLIIPIISSNKPNQRCFVGKVIPQIKKKKEDGDRHRADLIFTFSAWNNRNVTGLTGGAGGDDEGKATAWVCTPHLMLLWFLEPSLCLRCFPKCKDSPTRGGADARNTEAGRHKGDQIKSVWIVKVEIPNHYVMLMMFQLAPKAEAEKQKQSPKRWLDSKLATKQRSPDFLWGPCLFCLSIRWSCTEWWMRGLWLKPTLSAAHLPAHSQAYFPADQLPEPGEDANLCPCCTWCKSSLGSQQLYLTGIRL